MSFLLAALAVLSLWDYPSRQPQHEQLRRQFVAAVRAGDAKTMRDASQKGVGLLPDDPTWRFNLACSLAHFDDCAKPALDELERAIDLGYRDADLIEKDADLARLRSVRRFAELVEYAREMKNRPLMIGPMAVVDATGVFGKPIALGEQNLGWDFETGCFVAHLKLAVASAGGNTGDLYMNRDAGHAPLDLTVFPGLTSIRLDSAGRERGRDLNAPNIHFPYPVFGNCSRAFAHPTFWRSLPRAMLTTDWAQLRRMERFYLSNQVWVFPSNADTPPVGTNGDVFASIAPYWLTTAGRSYSDLPYLRAALEASRAFSSETKHELVKRGLLAPTIQTLLRKSLKGVQTEDDYLKPIAHPTALPPAGVDVQRLAGLAADLKTAAIPPLAKITMMAQPPKNAPPLPELTYASAFAWAFVLRSTDERRVFFIRAEGAGEFAFVQTHGDGVTAEIERVKPDTAKITLARAGLSPTNRVDITIVGRNPGTGWGAPSYVSFARMDEKAPYSDPALTPSSRPAAR